MPIAYLLGSLLLLIPVLHPPAAYSAVGDPPAGSPAGAVYQLPLEQGRVDAAPKGAAGAAGAAGAGAGESGGSGRAAGDGTASLYRTENNFGSSSAVPGVPAGRAAKVAGGDPERGGTGAGAMRAGGPGGAAEVADAGDTSLAGGIVLLGLIGLLAGGAGVLARRFRDR